MQYIPTILGFIVLALVILYFVQKKKKKVTLAPADISEEDRKFLQSDILFYQELSEAEQKVFEEKMIAFLSAVRITGIKTELTLPIT